MKKINGGKRQPFVPAVVTTQFRIQKRNQIADLIQNNSLLKEINESIILARVKEIENTIYLEHAANVHLYSSKIEKVVALFKGINQNNYINIAQKLKKQELAIKPIFKLLEKKKQLKDYDQDILNKTLQKSEYDPLNTKQISSKKTLLVTSKITIMKQKNQIPDSKGNFAAKPNMVFADSFQTLEPLQEKKVKIQKKEDDDDEIDIRINDGIQGAALIGVYCSKQITLFDNKVKIPIVLLVQFPPQYRTLCDKIDFSKLHNAKETIQFLSSNQERKILFGQVVLRPCEYAQNLMELSDKIIKQDKIVAQKFDKDNASFLILHKNQLEQILKARKQSLAFDASDMIIKEWAKQQSYLEWWGLNKQDHNLHFLISYKSVTNSSEQQIYEKVILQKPQCNPKIQQTINSLKQKKDIDDLLQGFLQTDLTQISFAQIGDMLQDQTFNQQVEQENHDEVERNEMDQDEEQDDNKNDDKPETNKISEQENKQINFNIKISDLTLQLSKDDYF